MSAKNVLGKTLGALITAASLQMVLMPDVHGVPNSSLE
jgi:hypothetical protein